MRLKIVLVLLLAGALTVALSLRELACTAGELAKAAPAPPAAARPIFTDAVEPELPAVPETELGAASAGPALTR